MAANGSNQKVASDFEKIINEARGRKKNEALAARIFNKDRRSSTPASSSNTKLSGAGSLASRAGVKKSRLRQSTGNINGEWTHDLHSPSQNSQPPKGPKALALGSLAARITDPSSPIPTGPRSTKKNRAAQVAQALIRTELQQQPKPLHHQQQQHRAPHNAPTGPSSSNAFKAAVSSGIQIRGLAGPYIVMAQNFAPGTTAADIESAMTRVGGIITSCRVVKHHPLVIAEIVFESKEGADEVVKAFDGQTADGRILSVYHKPGNTPTNLVPPAPAAPSNPSSSRGASEVVDGSYGFDEPMMDIGSNSNSNNSNNNKNNNNQRGGAGGRGGGFSNGNNGGNGKAPPTGPSGGLYSDGMIRRGRGFNNGYGRGRGGGGR